MRPASPSLRGGSTRPEALAARLFEWELHSEWETFYGAATTYADVLGEGGLAVFRKLAEEVWARVPAIEPGQDREHGDGAIRGSAETSQRFGRIDAACEAHGWSKEQVDGLERLRASS